MSACTYTCHKCQGGQFLKVETMKGKCQSPKLKNASKRLETLCSRKGKKMGKVKRQVKSENPKGVPFVIPLRRSARNAECFEKLSLKNTKLKKWKKRKQAKSEKGMSKKPNISSWTNKRTPVSSSYWLNGLQLSRRPNDERLMHFRSKMLLVLAGEMTCVSNKSKCSLCGEQEHKTDMNYVACEICGEFGFMLMLWVLELVKLKTSLASSATLVFIDGLLSALILVQVEIIRPNLFQKIKLILNALGRTLFVWLTSLTNQHVRSLSQMMNQRMYIRLLIWRSSHQRPGQKIESSHHL
ncbi:hypothetical protein OROGR_019407 [Orobanche gracilis]